MRLGGFTRPGGAVRGFLRAEQGAVTVDYVVLTAAVALMGLGVVASMGSGSSGISSAIQTELDAGGSGGSSSGGATGGGWSDSTGGGAAFTGGGGSADAPPPDHAPDPGDSGPEPSDTGTDSSGGAGSGGTGGGSDGSGNTDGGSSGPQGHAEGDSSGNSGNAGPPAGGAPGNASAGNSGAGGSSAGGSQDTPAPDDVDFTFDDLDIGCWWSNRAVSAWLTLNLAQPASFSLTGPGNPTAQTASGARADRGMVQWGTNIEIDIPPPGGSHTVYMNLDDEVGSFTITRARCN